MLSLAGRDCKAFQCLPTPRRGIFSLFFRMYLFLINPWNRPVLFKAERRSRSVGMRLGASQGDLLRADTSSSHSLLQPKATQGWIYAGLGQHCALSCLFRRFCCLGRRGAPLTPSNHKAKAITSSSQCLPGSPSVRFSHLGAAGAQGVHGITLLQVWITLSPRHSQRWAQIPLKSSFCSSSFLTSYKTH